jgi:hypothetical protein
MPPYSQEFVRELLDERLTLKQTIDMLKSGAIGHSLTPGQRATAINNRLEEAAEITSLIVAFSRHGNYPILCPSIDSGEQPVIRIHLPPAVCSGVDRSGSATRPGRVKSSLPPQRRKPTERSMIQTQMPELGQPRGDAKDL